MHEISNTQEKWVKVNSDNQAVHVLTSSGIWNMSGYKEAVYHYEHDKCFCFGLFCFSPG